jgi:UDP-2,3-diacylglucosamine pyrophosphatase LpxH
MNGKAVVVISDIHVGAGPLDDCDGELEGLLCQFFTALSCREFSVELVINGDFLEFLQAPPWEGSELESKTKDGIPLCFTQEQSVVKLEAIFKEHDAIFVSLGEFLRAKPDNSIVIQPGNHDADFFWPLVRKRFSEKVCGSDNGVKERLHFNLQQVYRPPDFQAAWIEHGHQYDPINSFKVNGESLWSKESPPILTDVKGRKRLYECLGTRFLIQYINELDSKYHFVDNIKPFSRFLRIFGVSAFAPGYGLIKAAKSVWGMIGYLASTSIHHPSDLLSNEQAPDPRPILKEWMKNLPSSERKKLADRLGAAGIQLGMPLDMYVEEEKNAIKIMNALSTDPTIIESISDLSDNYLSLGGDGEQLALGKGFFIKSETKILIEKAEEIMRNEGVSHLIMGHTHEPIANPAAPYYLNTGCWTRYYDFSKGGKMRSWNILKKNSYVDFPYKLNYAEITPGQKPEVRLLTFGERAYE